MATTNNTNSNSTAPPPPTNLLPLHSDNLSSPHSRHAARAVSSPWNQIVRGELEPIAAIPSSHLASSSAAIEQAVDSASSDLAAAESADNGNAGKRPAWNKPSNRAAAEVGPVMGAASWPALSESARASTKSSSESLKGLSDGSLVAVSLAGTGTASSSSQKQTSNNANPNSTPNHTMHARQRSMNRNGANTSFSNGDVSQQPAPMGPVVEMPPNNVSPRDHIQRSGFVSHSHSANDHPLQRNSFRSRNGSSHSREDGSHHHNHGGRRDQDRGNHDWNAHRNFNARDSHMQQQRPRFIRPIPPPPNSTPFIVPQRPFGSPMGFSPGMALPVYYVAAPPPETLRGVPFIAPIPPPVFVPALDPQLDTEIVNQIDYYFSNENLIKDTYLRHNMDDQGWVPIKLIAAFNRVKHLTVDIQLILDAVRTSTVVEVQGDKIRKRNDWMRWIMPPSVQFTNLSSPQSLGKSNQDMLVPHVQSIALEEKTANHSSARGQADVHAEAFQSRSSAGEFNNQSLPSSSEGTGQASVLVTSDHSISARNLSK